ncbi:MAG: laccase domain-containing protein, partial [Thermomonas sp.]
MIPPVTAWLNADWPAPPGVRALTTLRHGLGGSLAPFDTLNLGLRCGDEPGIVLENRQQLAAALDLPSSPRWLRQVHGVDVAIEPGEDEPEADAAVTSMPGVVLAILTADCLPVVFAAQDGSEIAAAHAGWRGLA